MKRHTAGTRHFRSLIATGYLLMGLLAGGIMYLWLQEWHELEALETENRRINVFRQEIHHTYAQTIKISLLGETVLEWEDEDVQAYHRKRLEVDSMLCRFKAIYPAERIDRVCHLLEDKEQQMRLIVQVLDKQETINERIAECVPVIAWKSAQEKPKKVKRKGLFGLFGKKKKPEPTATTTMLYTLNRDMIARQKAQSRQLSEHADSLAARNAELNRQLQTLIGQMDEKVQTDLLKRETEITAMRGRSFLQIGGLTGFIILLLVISYIIVHLNVKRINRYKKETSKLIGRLEESDRRNGKLISDRQKIMHTITHELRTPLTAIHGYAELIQGYGTVEARHHAESILQASKRMIAMLNSLLSFFRLESGKERMNIAPFRLQSVADALEAEFRPMGEKKDLKLTVENSADVILMGDRERIMQVGDNLLSNAIKYTPAGKVSLKTSYGNGTLSITVEDTGSGMSEEERHRVFREFERLSNAATQDGFGLGLSIVKRLVDLMHGTIRLESEKGRGSRFIVEIPMNTADSITSEEENNPKSHFERSFSVMVLDDNDILLSMVRNMYAHCGIRCDACDNTGDLMEAIRTRNYDFLITDLKMPETNGYEVLELLRSSDIGNSKTIPVIVATASGSCTEDELLAYGFTACLFKPFDMAELMAVSEKCLSQRTDKEEQLDLSSLLAYGDKTAMLDRLITETKKDMHAMRETVERLDRKALDGQVHRLRSSWAVIRADRPLWKLHELLHRNEKCSDDELRHSVNEVLSTGTAIIELGEKEKKEDDR